MKKSILTTIALAGFALGAFAQGSVSVSDSSINPGVTTGGSTYYNGAMTLQVWYLNGASIPNGIDNAANANAAYSAMTGDGFTLAQTYTATITSGTFNFGSLDIAGVNPAGANTEFALVAWNNTSSATYGAAETASALGGVVAFENPTANYATPAPNTPTPDGFTGWNSLGQNLAMTQLVGTVPEPATIAFAALGLGSFLVARRRK